LGEILRHDRHFCVLMMDDRRSFPMRRDHEWQGWMIVVMNCASVSVLRGLPVKLAALAPVLTLALGGGQAMAQAPNAGQTVVWSAAPVSLAAGSGRAVVQLRGAVRDGWHVYALKQHENGPTPLRVAVEANPLVTAAGAVVGSAPTVARDAAFNLDTAFYAQNFTLSVPVRVKAGASAIPLSVRFQTCNGQTCQPPKTLHLTADVISGERR